MNAPKPKPKSAFAGMETAPQDGTHLTLTDGKTETQAMWQKSRRFEGGKWQPKGKWVDPFTRSNISFEPTGWKLAPSPDEVLRQEVSEGMKQRAENEEAKR